MDRGSGVVNTAQQVGLAVGIAAMVGIATATTAASTHTPGPDTLVQGYSAGYLTGAALASLATVLALADTARRRNTATSGS